MKNFDVLKLINQALVNEFLNIFGNKIFESAVDINQLRIFDKASRGIVRDWTFINPELDVENERKVLVEVDSMEDQVLSGYEKVDLSAAMEELRNMDVFKLDEALSDKDFGELLEKRFKFKKRNDSDFKIDIESLINNEEDNE